MKLHDFGWNQKLQEDFEAYGQQGYTVGRIYAEHKHFYRIFSEEGDLLGELSGKMRFEITSQEEYPAVGDWVIMIPRSQEKRATIHGVLPRKSKLSRKVAGVQIEEQILATNIDYIFLVNALNHDFNIRKIERFLIMAWESGANPVIILSKADLCDETDEKLKLVESVAIGVPIHVISTLEEKGLEDLWRYFEKGATTVLLGSSGVGKSTLINYLTGESLMETQGIREGDDKGRHTTTHRHLLLLPNGGLIVDTPGIREMQLWNGEDGIGETFEDIEALGRECFFSDCRHQKEPNCAVKKAISEGTISESRLKNYQKLQRELQFLEKKQNLHERMKEKKGQRKK